jgi:hypothetical protein
MVSSGSMTLRLALSEAPERVKGEEQERLVTPRFCNPCVGFSKVPEHVEREGLRHEGGEGSA